MSTESAIKKCVKKYHRGQDYLDELGNKKPEVAIALADEQWRIHCLRRYAAGSVRNLPGWVKWVPPVFTQWYADWRQHRLGVPASVF